MTFDNAPSAIDGALLSASLIRRGQYADQPIQGVVRLGDLKVTELDTPGVGVQIAPGVGLVLNNYQTEPNETYVVSNPGVHVVPSVDMPPSSPSAKSFIVAVVIGDPDFSQVGHPFMTSDDPPDGEEQTFEYVRVRLIEVSAGATELTGAYPALPLARIDIPASTTTIIDSYITDLTGLAQARQEQQIFVSPGGTWTNASPRRISAASYADWGPQEYLPSVKIPDWANRAIVVASINGARLADSSANVTGGVRTQLGSVSGPETAFDFPSGRTGGQRENLQTAGEYSVSAIAGTTVNLRVEAFENNPASPSNDQRLALQSGSQMIFDVRFFEE